MYTHLYIYVYYISIQICVWQILQSTHLPLFLKLSRYMSWYYYATIMWNQYGYVFWIISAGWPPFHMCTPLKAALHSGLRTAVSGKLSWRSWRINRGMMERTHIHIYIYTCIYIYIYSYVYIYIYIYTYIYMIWITGILSAIYIYIYLSILIYL